MSTKISVFIPSIRPDTLPFAIRSILAQRHADWELLIVAQGAYPRLESAVGEAAGGDSRVRVVRMAEMGVSLARNAGVENARGEIVAMMDDDCEADRDWLAVIADSFARLPRVGMVSGSLVAPKPRPGQVSMCPRVTCLEAMYDPELTPKKPPEGWGFVTANCAARVEVARRAGVFDRYLGTGGHFSAGEDTDWVLQLERARVSMYSTPRSIVYHTYGIRYGLPNVMRMSRAYARGNGAVAGKLTLQGDARGAEWLRDTQRECTVGALHPARLHRLPFTLNRLRHFQAAYHECVTRFCVDQHGLLQQRMAQPEAGRQ